MQDLVEIGVRDGRIRAYVGAAISDCPQKDYLCYGRAIYRYVKDNVKYAFDPSGVELLEHPYYILSASHIGDCDSMAVVLATMYEQIDLEARFVTVKGDPQFPNDFTHVYVEVNIPGHGWFGADATVPKTDFGWVPPQKFPRKYWPARRTREGSARDDRLTGVSSMDGLNDLNAINDWLTADQPSIPAPIGNPQLGDWLRATQPNIPAPIGNPQLGSIFGVTDPMQGALYGAIAGAVLAKLLLKKSITTGAIAGAAAGYFLTR